METVGGIEFIVIGPGIARIGSSWLAENDEWGASDGDLLGRIVRPLARAWGEASTPSNEMPVHWVEFPEGFALAKTEITNAQYEARDPEHARPRTFPGDNDPVVNVTWQEATDYCEWLSEKSGRDIRLPRESEWEAACRAGSRTEYCFGDDEAGLGEYAWYDANSGNRAHEVGTKKANAWGLHDLHGNVWEWCEDLLRSYRLKEVVARGRVGVPYRGLRGGCWDDEPRFCRSSHRAGGDLGHRGGNLGFRPAMDAPEE